VFWVNPVQSSGDESLTDRKDSATAVPAADYRTVTLTGLDGSGYLRGQWANVVSETGDPAFAPAGGSYVYNRADDRFEQVMAYYWVTQAQLYLQGLGFGTGELPPVNMESQDVRINQYGADNSFSWDKKDLLRFGKGGVDDAEDAEVIVHEYGHAVHDAQVPGFGTSLDAGSIGEAFGDYLAVSVGLAVAGEPAKGVPAACVMDWDATSYTSTVPHCLRRVDTNLTVAQREGEVHVDGQIWSRALWDIRTALGDRTANRIIINAQFGFAPDTSFAAAATKTVQTAQAMYGTRAANTVTRAFQDRGIL
jgi:zinc metalloprotease ZmpB